MNGVKCLRKSGGFGLSGWLLAACALTGCQHLYYAGPASSDDPINPQTPFAFPVPPAAPALGGEAPPAVAPPVANPSGLLPVTAAPPQPAAERAVTNPALTVLRVGDMTTINFADLPPPGIPKHEERIREDGKITLPFNITVQAAGKTAGQLQEDIRKEYVPKYYNYLTVTVKAEERFYYVGGEVKIAGRIQYLGDMTVLRAIDTAGGFTDFANRKNIELRRATGEKIAINWFKAVKDPGLDKPVYANDQVLVHKRIW
jgi:polysaccharide export outer membrane protein